MTLAQRVREMYDAAKKDLGPALGGGHVTDLIADQIPEADLQDIRTAIIDSGVHLEWEHACQHLPA